MPNLRAVMRSRRWVPVFVLLGMLGLFAGTVYDPILGRLRSDVAATLPDGSAIGTGSGDMTGPALSFDNAVPRFNLTTGKVLQASLLYVDDGGSFMVPQATTPSSPASGWNRAYFKSDSKLYTLSSAGVESSVVTDGATPYLTRLGVGIAADATEALVTHSGTAGRGVRFINSDATGGQVFVGSDHASPADGDVVGTISFKGQNSGAMESAYALIKGEIQTPTFGALDSILRFEVFRNDAQVEILRLDGTSTENRAVMPYGLKLGDAGLDGSLVIYSEQGGTDYAVTIQPHATMTQAVTLTLPANDGDAGQCLKTNGSGNLSFAAETDLINTRTTTFGITIDGGGSAITTGVKGYCYVPYSGNITAVTVLSDLAPVGTSVVVDIWKCAYADYAPGTHPVDADTITSATPPTLTATNFKVQDTTLTTWTKAVAAGSVYAFNVDATNTVTRLHVIVTVGK